MWEVTHMNLEDATQKFHFVTSGKVTDDLIREEVIKRNIDPTKIDCRWYSSYNHPRSWDRYVEVMYRPGKGEILWQKGDPDAVPHLSSWGGESTDKGSVQHMLDMDLLAEALQKARHKCYAQRGRDRRLLHLSRLESLCRWWVNGGWPGGEKVDLRPVWRYLHRRQLPYMLRSFSLRGRSSSFARAWMRRSRSA